MKKKLTLMFVALLALTAFAIQSRRAAGDEVKYALNVGDSFNSGQTVEVKDGTDVVATITYGETGGNAFNAAVAAEGDSSLDGYTAYTTGNGTNGNKSGGTFYTIKPVYNGTINIAVILNADKAFYIEEDGTALADYNGITVGAKYYGTYKFDVKAGKSYKVYCSGSKLSFYGFTYVYEEPSTVTYAVNVDDGITNGSVKVDKATAAEGEEVTITATPAEGYMLDAISVTCKNKDEAVTVKDGKFTMPADDVTVNATFKVAPVDVAVAAGDITGGDITAAITAKAAGKPIKDLTITLAAGDYKVTAPMVACGNIAIIGAAGATIDASALEANMIEYAVVESPTEWTVANVSIKSVGVKGLKKALFYSACKNYVAENFIIDDCVVEQAADATTIDYTKGSTAKNITVTNSTFYAPTATTKSFYSSQGGQKTTEYKAEAIQTFKFEKNTMYNLAKGKNFFSHRQSNQKWMTYDVKNNIFVDCGKSGQVIKGMNGGSSGTNPVWDIYGNAFNFGGADTSANEETGDAAEPVKNSVPGVVVFANADYATTGNFKLANCAQNTAHIGDPRWLDATVEPEPEDIVISPEEGADIYTALFNATTGVNKKAKDIYIYLAPGKKFTISQSIEAPAAFAIMGAPEGTNPSTIDETATMAEIDASALTGPLVQMSKTPAVDANAVGFYPLADVGFLNVKVTGLAQQLFYANKVKYLFNDFHVNFCNIQVAGGSKTIIDTNGGGVIADLDISKNTIWANPAHTGQFYSSQSGQKATEAGLAVQTFNIERNTMYNIAYDKNVCTHRQSNQTWLTYNVRKNVFVNCGKSGQVIKGMNGGQSGANPTWNIDGNIFNFDGADTSAAEATGDDAEPVKNSVAGVVIFKDATNGDFDGKFMLAIGADAPAKMPGDPRWVLTVATSQTVTTAASGYTTLVSAYPLDFTTAAGLTAYVVAADGDIDIANSKVKLTQVTEAAANTPVILKGTANTEYTITPKADAAAVTGNLLKGSATTATTLTDGEAYLLKDGKFGLCTAGDLPAGKAYLPKPAGSASNELIIVIDGEVTGIDKVVTRDALENAKIYNLQGQEVKKAGKGIYIINGKKVVMK